MRDLFDDFLEELRRREAAARGEDPGPPQPPASRREPDRDDDRADENDPTDDERDPTDDDHRDGGARQAWDDGAERGGAAGDDKEEKELPKPLPIDAGRRRSGTRGGRRPPGGPNDGGARGSRAARAGRRFGLVMVVLVAIALFILFSVGLDLWTDALWFTSVGFEPVFWTRIGATLGLFAATFLLATAILLANLWVAGRLTPPPDAERPGSFRSFIDRMNDAAQSADIRRDRPGGMSGMRGRDTPQGSAITFDAGDLPDLTPLAGGALV